MQQRWKNFLKKYPHAWMVSYFVIYFIWFVWLERCTARPYFVIHSPLDNYIPFCEYFVIPYFLWFLYVGAVYFWLFFHDRTNFYKYAAFLYIGMTLFLIISTIYPNGHLLRPASFSRDNVFIRIVCFLYWADTSTNILPSIHVLNSIAAHAAIMHTPSLMEKKRTVWCSRILSASIILSTMFLKQHSCIDVALGILLGLLFSQIIYNSNILVKAHDLVGKLVGNDGDLTPAFSRKVHRPAKNAKV